MPLHDQFTARRRVLGQAASLLAAPFAASALGQPAKVVASGRSITVAQIFDGSAAQQDVSKDFLIGSRAFWQDLNSRGGLRGRSVNHVSLEVDGSPAALAGAVASLKDNPDCVVLSGTASDPVANQLVGLLRRQNVAIAHAAPWLQNSSGEVDDRTFPIFAARQEQIGHALKSLTVMGIHAVGAVYASAHEYGLYHQDLERIATEFKLKLETFRGEGDLSLLGQRLSAATPAILLFIGGTPELVQFTQGLEKQTRQRYVVALADVNLQTMVQMGAARNTPVIATQVVPMVNASLPVVRSYRETMSRLFDEPAAPLSLAGFIAARYTHEVLAGVEANLTRQSALAAFRKRASLDMGGFRVSFDPRRRSATYVTQSMLAVDGRVVG